METNSQVVTNGFGFVDVEGGQYNLDALEAADTISFDIESTGVHTYKDWPYGFSLAHDIGCAYYSPVNNPYFMELLAEPGRLHVGHNIKFDRSQLKKCGVVVDNVADTMIAAHLLHRDRLSLEELSLDEFGKEVHTFKDRPKPINDMTYQEMADYFGHHSTRTLALWEKYEPMLHQEGLDNVFWNLEMPLVPVLSDIELNGVAVSADRLNELGAIIDAKLEVYEDSLIYWADGHKINFNSPQQVKWLFFEKLNIPKPRFGPLTVDKRYLKKVIRYHRIIPVYLAYKELRTLKSSYVNSLLKDIVDGRVYGNFNQARVGTGRLSSSGPNLQKIPKRTELGKQIRTAFIAPEGHKLVRVDFDQIEFVRLAIMSGDPFMVDAFISGRDLHTETAIRAYKDAKRRSDAKALNYQIIFGGGSIKERQIFYRAFPIAAAWIEQTEFDARKAEGHIVKTAMGRQRKIMDTFTPESYKLISPGGREAVSTRIQGSAAEDVKLAMRRIWDVVRDSCAKIVLQVHDELVFQVPENHVDDLVDVIKRTMPTYEMSRDIPESKSMPIPITVSIEVGDNWGSTKEIAKGVKRIGL